MELVVDKQRLIAYVNLTQAEADDLSHKAMNKLITDAGLTRTSPWVYSFAQKNQYCAEVTKTGEPRVGGARLI